MLPNVQMSLCGERFRVVYRLAGEKSETHDKALNICVEQTVEFPTDLVPQGVIQDQIVGRLESFDELGDSHCEAVISYAVETSGFELVQLLNVTFGNSSIIPGIRVERLELPEVLLNAFRGPRFGTTGVRAQVQVRTRPLLCTALKPMGLPPQALEELAYQFAIGGIDIIKDDHGLADQPFCPFRERVERCAQAVHDANQVTGLHCIYVPNISAPAERVHENALYAKQAGAGGLLISPGLVGADAVRRVADDDRIALPIFAHPAFWGSFLTSRDSGISPFVLFGQISRLMGADATIFPNYGGRFSFTREECVGINLGCVVPMGHLRPILPVPAGGMSLARVPEMRSFYGDDVIFLIGGGLHKQGPDLVANCREFLRLVPE